MEDYTDLNLPWGEFVEVKINAVDVLFKDLRKVKGGTILLSSITDPYQPIEEKYEITRSLLMNLKNTSFSINILTKNDLIKRDLKLINKLKNPSVGITLNFINEKNRKIWEPGAASVKDRLDTIKKIGKENIYTYIHIGPYLPEITNLKQIIRRVNEYVDEIQVEKINFNDDIMEIIRNKYPQKYKKYKKLRKNQNYLDKLTKRKIDTIEHNLNEDITLFLD
ncbi:MAG: DNA repair photolyase SplB [Candidatus Methanohalarchaeum thermophilum]|uniref:DNA repair photolyase SplB n=1 Tax=Methanohalarchaeum thermophilum TaxID=1903181 RepID=A0A1Q6DUD7_METT1|nr:MAG: DNA repair photolyase SplB [Candidatus Methanohalarchaeum thermophilum]